MAPKTHRLNAPGPEGRRLLEPEVVSKLRNMELRARLVVEGFIQGLHRSPYHGFSVEFAEYRQYMPGDSPRFVDWKVYAKTDRYYMKVFEEETNLKCVILLDKSASMGFAGKGITKLRWASLLAASLGFLMLKQQDATGLVMFDDQIRDYIPARSVRAQLHEMLGRLERVQPSDRTNVSDALHAMAERLKRRGLVVLISDLLDDPAKILNGLQHFRHRQHEVLVFHVLDDLERTFDYSQEARFVDLETGREIRTQPWFIKAEYRQKVESWMQHLARECRRHLIDYVPMTTSTPFDLALLAYLNKRSHLG
ncbi:MAG TPA: DUF58 domain-containing protein [Candidatus Krumholzibacteria bacterium]|jgi:uncharacterized protein (DUF58 family)|nr:DUF58 domain-containing protein [Candidatus Krumholzibacteria bacterium]